MSSGQGDVEAGKAYVRVTASDQQAIKAIDRFANRFKAMGKTVSAIGARMGASVATSVGAVTSALGIQRIAADAIAVAMVGAALAWSSAASDAVDMADRLGMSVEAVTGLSYAAEQCGAEVGDLEAGMRNFQRTVVAAAQGSKAATQALADVGLTAKDLKGLAPEEQFKILADRLSKMEDPAKRTAAAMSLLGKSGAKLIPLLQLGRAGIDALIARATELGIVLSDEDARAAEAFGDAVTDLKKTLFSIVYALGSALVPTLMAGTAWLTEAASSVRKWVHDNRQLVKLAFLATVALTGVGLGLWLIGGAMSIAGTAITLVTGFFGLLAKAAAIAWAVLRSGFGIIALFSAIKAGVAMLAAGVSALFGAIAAAFGFLVTPLGMAIAAIVAVGAYLVYTTAEGGAMLDWLGGKFRQLAADAVEAWGGISAALAAGDLGLAARIAFSFVALEAAKAYKTIWEAWYGFKDWFVGLFTDAYYGALVVLANVVATMQTWWEGFKSFFSEAWYGAVIVAANVMAKLESWWASTVGFFGNIWDSFTGAFMQAWNTATGWISKEWTKVMSLISDDVDVAAEIKRIDEETAAANEAQQKATDQSIAARDQQKNDRLAGIERDRAAAEANAVQGADANQQQKSDRLRQIEQDRVDAEAGIVMNADAAKAQRSAASDAAIKSMQDGIDADRKAYQDLLDEAQRKKAAAENADPNAAPSPKRPNAAGLNSTLSSKRDESPTGSFNAAASFSFVKVQGPLDRIAEGIDETNELLSEGNRLAEKNAAGMAATP